MDQGVESGHLPGEYDGMYDELLVPKNINKHNAMSACIRER
jgi:hypothetical protein